jgi:hypothetical protein
MILIDEIIVDNVDVKFYEGMDVDKLLNHPKDGSNGFIYCFIDNWVNEIKTYNRQRKISSVIDDIKYKEFEWDSEINNNYICIYQTEGMLIKDVYETIRKKLDANQFPNQPWVPVSGIGKGAIKIESKKIGIENKYIS